MFKLLEIASKAEIPEPIPLKKFVPKFELPLLERYDLSAPQDYWCKWPKNYKLDMESNINFELFRELAVNAGFEDLKFGAMIGCQGEFRKPV